jgi:hypothetical protein
MINPYLRARLLPAWQRHRRWQLLSRTALWLSLAALLGWLRFHGSGPASSEGALGLWTLATVLGQLIILALGYFAKPDYRALACRIEARHPALDGRLLTAVEINPEHEPAFIQERLLQETIQHGLDHDWKSLVRPRALDAVQAVSLLAAGACAAIFLLAPAAPVRPVLAAAEGSVKLSDGIEVTPGDTALEKGSSLLVMVRFTESVPSTVELVTGNTPETERRQLLVRSLNDPIFGGSVPDVKEDFRYRVNYDGKRTRDFSVKVFEYPKLERSDVSLTYPAWTKLPEKRTGDTRRASAVEGTRLRLDLQLNKPVAAAVLKPREKEAAEVPLAVDPQKAIATLTDFPLVASQVYELILTDSGQRVNKVPAVFTIEVLPNQPPAIKLTSPKGDQRPSALEEMLFTGTVSDDFGVLAWGMAFTHGGGDPVLWELGKDGPAGAAQTFQHLLRLEEMQAQPDDLISWFVWADDIGPDGKTRRTEGDLFFGEVRPFDEIFRQGEEAAGGAPPPPPGEGGAGEQAAKLAELQKQIINATWKLQRTANPPAADIGVVRNSQTDALGQATGAAAESSSDARVAAGWKTAQEAMKQAGEELEAVEKQPAPLTAALAAEQKAYQALLAVRAREIRISRSRTPGQPASASEQQRQMEMDEMDLTKEENRYQMESEAQAPQEAAQREQRQVLNRLQELARRQEEVNERLKELQTALQAAETEDQKEELKRELKRLEEEQRQTLADVDELNQRMEKPENQEPLAQEKKELEEARQNVQEAAKATAEGNVAQALSSGTRAQRQLEEMREELRRKSSSAFSGELRDLRSEARDLANRQEKVTEQLEQLENPKQRTLSDTPEREAAQQQLTEQQQRTRQLTKKATELSESAEGAEPLVSRQLYDSMRKFAQEDAASVKETQQKLLAEGRMTRQFMEELNELQQNQEGGKALEMTSGLLEQDLLEEAKAGAQAAKSGIQDFKSGIERAAENVLGDDTEALKRADRELEQLTKDLEKEMAGEGSPGSPTSPDPAGSGEPQTNGPPGSAPGQNPGKAQTAPTREAASNPPGQGPAEGEGTTPGQTPSQEQAQGQGQGEAQPEGEGQGQSPPGQPGQSPGQGQSPGEGQGSGEGQGEPNEGPGEGGEPNATARGGNRTAGGRGGSAAPLTGDGYAPWSDRLREVEEIVDFPDLRNDIANARERARQLRVETKRDLKKPDWAVVRTEVMQPLVEVRQRLREELARRTSRESLVPIDRDPVPGRYAEQVRRYYEQLGKEP